MATVGVKGLNPITVVASTFVLEWTLYVVLQRPTQTTSGEEMNSASDAGGDDCWLDMSDTAERQRKVVEDDTASSAGWCEVK